LFSRILDIPVYYRHPDTLHDNPTWRWFYFNEIVGWIWLQARPTAIRAEYCFIRQRPSRVLVRREFEPRGKLFQVGCRGLANADVFARLSAALLETQQVSHLRAFWIDLGAFNTAGPTMDWQGIMRGARV